MKTNFTYFFLIFFTVLNFSCSSGDSSSSSTSGSMNVMGIVTDESNNPISGATIKSGSSTTTSNATGEFTLTNVAFQERTFVEVKAVGFFDGYRGFAPVSGQTQVLDIMMESKGTPTNFNSSTGATLSNSGGNVVIGSNSVMDANGNIYSGTVKAYMRMHNPSQTNFSQIMQGGDFAGQNASGEQGVLSSYGFYSVEMEDANGNPLNIKTGSSAAFSVPIADSQLSTAQNTIKLWSFDKSTAMWKEEGTATKVGNKYSGTVTHFSQWNCDDWSTTATITGRVVCGAQSISGTTVTITNGTNILYTLTGSGGNFSIKIPSGFAVVVTIPNYEPINVAPLATNQIKNLGTLNTCPDSNPSALQQTLSGHTWITNQCFRDNDGYGNSITFNSDGSWSASPSLFIDEPFEQGEYPISWYIEDTSLGQQIWLSMMANTGDPQNPFEVIEEYFGPPVSSFTSTTVNFIDLGNGCPEKITRQ